MRLDFRVRKVCGYGFEGPAEGTVAPEGHVEHRLGRRSADAKGRGRRGRVPNSTRRRTRGHRVVARNTCIYLSADMGGEPKTDSHTTTMDYFPWQSHRCWNIYLICVVPRAYSSGSVSTDTRSRRVRYPDGFIIYKNVLLIKYYGKYYRTISNPNANAIWWSKRTTLQTFSNDDSDNRAEREREKESEREWERRKEIEKERNIRKNT
jgi:hypothetical protein